MIKNSIQQNVASIRNTLSKGNAFGEPVILVAATKMQPPEAINEAILAGVDAVAENKPQEFRDKNDKIMPCAKHFIGHLQTNKLKYIVGKADLIHSCDRDDLADAIANLSVRQGIVSNILIQINVGEESTKSGYSLNCAKETFLSLNKKEGLCVKGFMAMLPLEGDEAYFRSLVKKMRGLFEWAKEQSKDVEYLSMGMSGDYLLCVEEGSNMVRIGSTIFGERNYTK